MKTKHAIVLVCLFVTSLYSYSQDLKLIDSLQNALEKQDDSKNKVKTFEELYYAYIYSEPKKAKPYIEKALELSKKIGHKQGEAVALYNIGTYHHMAMEVDSARSYYNLANTIFIDLNDDERMGSVVSSLGKLEVMEGNFDEALTQFDKALEIAKKNKNQLHIGNALVSIGDSYMNKGNYKIALEKTQEAVFVLDTISSEPWRKADALKQVGRIEYLSENFEASIKPLQEALQIYIDSNDNVWEGHALCDIGNAYYALKDYDKAIDYFTKSLEIGQTYEVKDLIANSLSNLGQVFASQKSYDKAIEYITKGNKINEEANSINNTIISFNQLGTAYHGKKDYQKALFNFNKAIKLSDSIGLIDELKNGYANRSETYEAIGNLKNALRDKKEFIKFNDSIFNKEKSQQLAFLRTSFETERKEQEIVYQKNEIELLQQKQKASTLQKTLLALGIISLIAIFSFTYYALKQRIRRNALIRENLDKDIDFKNKELTTHALHLAQKNEVLESLKQKVQELKANNSGQGCQQIIQAINFNLQDDNNWDNFSRYFEQVHSGFNTTIKKKYPGITTNELRLMALLKMNMSSKEIASILNISNEGVKKARYRLRKKLDLTSDDSLQDAVLQL